MTVAAPVTRIEALPYRVPNSNKPMFSFKAVRHTAFLGRKRPWEPPWTPIILTDISDPKLGDPQKQNGIIGA